MRGAGWWLCLQRAGVRQEGAARNRASPLKWEAPRLGVQRLTEFPAGTTEALETPDGERIAVSGGWGESLPEQFSSRVRLMAVCGAALLSRLAVRLESRVASAVMRMRTRACPDRGVPGFRIGILAGHDWGECALLPHAGGRPRGTTRCVIKRRLSRVRPGAVVQKPGLASTTRETIRCATS